jgi:hypothetical protein
MCESITWPVRAWVRNWDVFALKTETPCFEEFEARDNTINDSG